MTEAWSLFKTSLALTVAASIGTGCIDLKKARDDRRSATDSPAAEPEPVPTNGPLLPPTEAPAPAALVPAAGRYVLSEFVCPGNKTEAAKGDLFFVSTKDDARFERALTPTCNAFQPVTRTMDEKGLTLVFKDTLCAGVCGERCLKQLVAETGSRLIYQHTVNAGGFRLHESGTTFPAACGGNQPLTMQFAARDPATCTKHWTLTGNEPTDTALVLDGALKWSIGPVNQGAERTLTQGGLTGDFTVTVRFTDFGTEGRGGYFRVRLESVADSKSYAYAMVTSHTIARGAEPALVAALGVDGTDAEEVNATVSARAGRTGSLTIKRRGRDLTVTAADGDGHTAERVLAADASFAGEPYRLKLQMGNNYTGAPAIEAVGISTEEVIISDGRSNVLPQSDRFECDSL